MQSIFGGGGAAGRCSWTIVGGGGRDNGKTPAVLENVDILIFVAHRPISAGGGKNRNTLVRVRSRICEGAESGLAAPS